MKTSKIILSLLLLIINTGVVFSQLEASNTIGTDIIEQQNLHLFFFKNINGNTIAYMGEEQSAVFNWYQFNIATKDWIATGSDRQISITEEGGYKLEILQDAIPVDTLYGWAFIPEFYSTAIVIDTFLCSGTSFSAENKIKKLVYYDSSLQEQEVDYGFVSEWIDSDEEQYNGNNIEIMGPYYTQYNPGDGAGECEFAVSVAVTDRFGIVQNDTLDYCNPIAVKADMEWAVRKGEVLNEIHDSISSASAPVEILFTGAGKGAVDTWTWSFTLGENEISSSNERNPFYVFTDAGAYMVTYIVKNSECTDINSSLSLTVEESYLGVPNVFTPNGDGINDEFRVAYRSLKKFRMIISSRWGRKVYESTDPAKGWDGTVGGNFAPPGVYFYFIEAEGYKENEKHKRDGSVHLIREKN
ncbi:MAG: gliding motility-associated C-terminal domain-containing protein [Cytophagaceae bacterium]|jgi:gliding motility-associated-like protein|nr:gliding motility-associated C-terminal domain-containing protein [Cytophagaceae bacterium]